MCGTWYGDASVPALFCGQTPSISISSDIFNVDNHSTVYKDIDIFKMST